MRDGDRDWGGRRVPLATPCDPQTGRITGCAGSATLSRAQRFNGKPSTPLSRTVTGCAAAESGIDAERDMICPHSVRTIGP